MTSNVTDIAGIPGCRITRCGYTGEDGVEISLHESKTEDLVEKLLSKSDRIKLAGLGARDSLRLEAGLCLYGNDIDETTTPIEGNLTWTVGKGRRQNGRDTFPGAAKIIEQIKAKKTSKKRIGLISEGMPARGQTKIVDLQSGDVIGHVTSGCPSPSLKVNVAMGYVAKGFTKNGTKVGLKVRNKIIQAQVSKMPFVPSNYYMLS